MKWNPQDIHDENELAKEIGERPAYYAMVIAKVLGTVIGILLTPIAILWGLYKLTRLIITK